VRTSFRLCPKRNRCRRLDGVDGGGADAAGARRARL
jgi:hypothetical protein